jgi:hypothetical protein
MRSNAHRRRAAWAAGMKDDERTLQLLGSFTNELSWQGMTS